jgi:hypothetical protein
LVKGESFGGRQRLQEREKSDERIWGNVALPPLSFCASLPEEPVGVVDPSVKDGFRRSFLRKLEKGVRVHFLLL